MKTILINIIIFCIACTTLFAQEETQYKITHYDEYDGLSQRYTTQIVQGDDGFIWIGTWNGLNRFDGYDFKCFKTCEGDGSHLPSVRFVNIENLPDGNILCQVDNGLYLFDTKTYLFRDLRAPLENKFNQKLKLFNIFHTEAGELFFEFDNQIVIKTSDVDIIQDAQLFSRKDVELPTYPYIDKTYPSPELNGTGYLYRITDESGNEWLSSYFGVFKVVPIKSNSTQELFSEYSSQIRSILKDNHDRQWITGREDKCVRINETGKIKYLRPNGTTTQQYTSFGASVYCIFQDSNNNIWLGCKPEGLYKLKEREQNFDILTVIPASEYDNFGFYDIKEDAQGRMWVATFGEGVKCLIPKQNESEEFDIYTKIDKAKTRHLFITDRQELLVATTDGLYVADINESDIDKIKFNKHGFDPKRNDCLSNNATMFIFQDSRGTIYVCTESGGVNQIISKDLLSEELSFSHFDTTSGFPTDIALSMFEYEDNLWIVSNNQLMRFNPTTNECISFDNNYFKSDFRFSDATPLQLSEGQWMFGLQNGAIIMNLQTMKKSEYIPKIAITGVSIQNGEIDYSVNHCDTICLKPDERCLTIYFAALDYAADNNLRYSFSLDKGTWNFLDKNHSVTLLDLSPGTYSLKIRSTNHDLVWVDNERTITILVTPAWWETIYAKILFWLLIIAFLALVIGVINHIRKINIRQKNLEAYLAYLESDQMKQQKTIDKDSLAEQPENTENNTELHQLQEAELQLLEKAQIKAVDDAFMKRILAFIEQHIGNPDISISDMAEASATSLAGLNRKMKQILGTTPNEFLREARIQKACVLLKDPTIPINDIAFLCGFSDSKYFSRSFKSKKGVAPSEFRSKYI